MTGPAYGAEHVLDDEDLYEDFIDTPTEVVFPNPSSVAGRILSDLLAGGEITHLDCWNKYGAARLAHQIYTLRSCGWAVVTNRRRVKTSDGDRTATIAFYSFPEEMLQEVGPTARRQLALLRAAEGGF